MASKNRRYRKKTRKLRKSRKNKITQSYKKKYMKGGRPTKLTVKRFNRIKHFWDNTGLTLANNSFWYLYENNLLRARLNTNVNEISNYETLERLIKERGNLNDNTTELPENMHLEFELENN
jgi:hypothetical protein